MKRHSRRSAPALALAALLGACASGDRPEAGQVGLAEVAACWSNALGRGALVVRGNSVEVSCGELRGSDEAPQPAAAEPPSRLAGVVAK